MYGHKVYIHGIAVQIMYINIDMKIEQFFPSIVEEGQVRNTLNQLFEHVLVMLLTRTSWFLKSIH